MTQITLMSGSKLTRSGDIIASLAAQPCPSDQLAPSPKVFPQWCPGEQVRQVLPLLITVDEGMGSEGKSCKAHKFVFVRCCENDGQLIIKRTPMWATGHLLMKDYNSLGYYRVL